MKCCNKGIENFSNSFEYVVCLVCEVYNVYEENKGEFGNIFLNFR